MKHIRIGIRPSQLALRQAEEVLRRFSEITCDMVPIETQGDKDKKTPLTHVENSDFFTKEIERALLAEEIDVAVHSAKDLEETMPQGLTIAMMTPSPSMYECLVSRNQKTLYELPAGAVIGTSSVNRKQSIRRFRRDLIVKNIRGTIDERISQMNEGLFDAIIIAHVALMRLGWEYLVAEIISPNIIEPHPLQGRLVVQARADDKSLITFLREKYEYT